MKNDLNVLVIGGGGREHAVVRQLAQSPRIGRLYAAPGNPGTDENAENIPIEANDIEGLVRFAQKEKIGLTFVGPDDPLALGVVDEFRMRGLRIFGPTRAAARIESSKVFAKNLMRDAGIPTAAFRTFHDYETALAYIRAHGAPIVVKASGLALGKGVYPCATIEKAKRALKEIMVDRVHKNAGNEVVIEEFLEGPEISIHALSDGKTSVVLPPAQDHKPIGEDNIGKNTGGMGTIAPVAWMTPETMKDIDALIVRCALDELKRFGRPFTGLLYPGLKMTNDGPKVLEYNARFGDPETQVYMRLLKTDLLDILEACVDGTLDQITIEWRPGFAVCIVLASGGYPDAYQKGFPIMGIAEAEKIEGVKVFHAGTTIDSKGELVTAGGRVLGVSARGSTLQKALDRAYQAAALIQFEGKYYRRDIGAKALTLNM